MMKRMMMTALTSALLVGVAVANATELTTDERRELDASMSQWGKSLTDYREQTERYLNARIGGGPSVTNELVHWMTETVQLTVADTDPESAAKWTRLQADTISCHQLRFHGLEFTNAWLAVGRLARKRTEEYRTMNKRDRRTWNLLYARENAGGLLASSISCYCTWGEIPNLPEPRRTEYLNEVAALGILDENDLQEIRDCFAREDLRREEWQKNLERRLRRHRPRKSKNPGMSGISNPVLQ